VNFLHRAVYHLTFCLFLSASLWSHQKYLLNAKSLSQIEVLVLFLY
jgi:hypothetical protein